MADLTCICASRRESSHRNCPVHGRVTAGHDTQPIEWWKKLTPLQRVVIAVLRAAMSESAKERELKGLYEDAIYGRP